ncbi:MarR family transcriptional regulator [Streptomyces sp. NPDC059382]|uniref:MarR family transcriptional regulator n=1 Tax=Streptomyces sp. NPDC059382 TaxID=3346816 RepID=UPI0036C95174
MTEKAPVVSAVETSSGEVMQLELLGVEALSEALQRKPKIPPRYDWRPHPGRHVNVGKGLMAKVWDKDSGYSRNDRDILGFFMAHSPEGGSPLRMNFKEIAELLGVRQDSVAASVAKLHAGGLLLLKEEIGRMRFFAPNPRAAFDGPAVDQLEATKAARHPVVPAPALEAKPKRTRKAREAS